MGCVAYRSLLHYRYPRSAVADRDLPDSASFRGASRRHAALRAPPRCRTAVATDSHEWGDLARESLRRTDDSLGGRLSEGERDVRHAESRERANLRGHVLRRAPHRVAAATGHWLAQP